MANPLLSNREWEVAELLLQAKSNKQIAEILHITESTVEYHLQHLYAKLGVESRTAAILILGKTPIPSLKERQGKSIVAGSGKVSDDGENLAQGANMNQSPLPKPSSKITASSIVAVVAVLIALISLVFAAMSWGRGSPGEAIRLVTAEVTRVAEVTRQVEVTRLVEVSRLVEVTRLVEVAPPAQATPDPVVYRGPSMSVARYWHTMTRMADGRILFAGGNQSPDVFLSQAEIYDPATNQFHPAASMHTARLSHSATGLQDGRVLVVGGYNLPSQWLTDAELYDPASDTWIVVPPLYSHGGGHTATLLPDGRVLVAGGGIGSSICTDKVEVFDPASLSWLEMPPMPSWRAGHTATLLRDGRVLIAGGNECHGLGGSPTPEALLFDPQTETWSPTGPMAEVVCQHEAALLADGRVLVAGGLLDRAFPDASITSIAQIYDPTTNTWSMTGQFNQPRFRYMLVTLSDGRVVMAGSSRDWDDRWNDSSFVQEIELYDPQKGQWQVIGELPEPRAELAALLMPDGTIWLTGGRMFSKFWSSTWVIAPKKAVLP